MSPRTTSGGESALVAHTGDGEDHTMFESWIRQHNRRLFRVARSILRDDAEAEDAMQDAYIKAYRHMRDFNGRSQPGTWLTRIVINQALMRLRQHRRDRAVVGLGARKHGVGSGSVPEIASMPDHGAESPPARTLRAELRRLLERRIDELPVAFCTVFMMREVEEMSVEETAQCLGIPEATVRSRLFRAKGQLRELLAHDLQDVTGDLFRFEGEQCDRVVADVMTRLSGAREQRGGPMHLKGDVVAPCAFAQAPSDAEIAHIVVTANQVDIDAGTLAASMASDPQVMSFGKMMASDHTGVNKQAAALAGKLGVTPADNATSKSLKAGGDKNLAHLKTLKGGEFDRAYIANEVAYHQAVLQAVDKTLIPSAQNAELKALIEKVRPAFVAHLELAKKMQASLK
jgi:RNA polymerase sigma factor (sigma-70 family)